VRDFEDRIRRELTAVAAQAGPGTIRPLRAPALGSGPRASRWLAPVAAMVAVAAIAGVTVAGREIARGPASAVGQPVGHPGIYVTLAARYLLPFRGNSGSGPVVSAGGIVLSATVRNASTGAALTSVQLWPRQPEHPRGPAVSSVLAAVPAQIAAAADDRTFAISDPGGLYLLHVAASGRTAQLVKLRTLPTEASSTIALSPDGTQLAVDLDDCPANGACVDGMEIVNVATGTARTWLGSTDGGPLNPFWTDNGKALMFQWTSGGQVQYRILSDAARQGNLIAESARLPYPPRAEANALAPTAVLTPDGSSLLIETESVVPASHNSGSIIFRITDVDPRTGRLLRVLRVFKKHYQGNPYLTRVQCNILALAPTGLHVLAVCPQFGRLDGSTFTPLPSGSPGLPNAPAIDAAW
jgi:hypothetical protein